jgi:hypothetical protein
MRRMGRQDEVLGGRVATQSLGHFLLSGMRDSLGHTIPCECLGSFSAMCARDLTYDSIKRKWLNFFLLFDDIVATLFDGD